MSCLKLNQIVVTGSYTTKGSRIPNEKFKTSSTILLGNNLSVRKYTYELRVQHNFREIFCHTNLSTQIKNTLELELKEKILQVKAKVSNIHYTITLKYNYVDITTKLLPLIIENGFEINSIEINQEGTIFFKSDIRTVLNGKNNFVSLRIKTCDHRISALLQPSKSKKEVSCSIIASTYNKEIGNFLDLLKENHGYGN